MKEYISIFIVALIASLIGGFVAVNLSPSQDTEKIIEEVVRQLNLELSGVTNFDAITLDNGNLIVSNGTITSSGKLIVNADADVGNFTQGGGCTASSTTVATETWTQAFMLTSNCFTYSGTAAAAAITITLPATSTMTTLLPNVGDSRVWFYDPSAYVAATTTTFAAGTGGILLEPNDGDNSDVVIAGATSAAFITGIRLANTDVVWLITEVSDAD